MKCVTHVIRAERVTIVTRLLRGTCVTSVTRVTRATNLISVTRAMNVCDAAETLEGELSRAMGVLSAEGAASPSAVFQAVKAICALAGGVETLHVTHTLNAFAQACNSQVSRLD